MLFISQKYKPMLTKPVENKVTEPMTTMQGKGLNELIEKVKDLKVKEINKKRKLNSNSKISFD